jgi:glucose-6-phosphate dehydrogenase assembly protein OpcA
MPTTYKVLGQSNPAANTDTTLYTVPSATSAIVSTINVANLGTSGTFRIAVRVAGASIANEDYLAFDIPLNANDSIAYTLGITLAATDVITVRATNALFAFNAFGSEIT